jgi:hypothetical protein
MPDSERLKTQDGRCQLHIERLTVTDDRLRLDYSVTNRLGHDIWVCEDVRAANVRHDRLRVQAAGPTDDLQDVATRIVGDTLWIRLRFNLEQNVVLPWAVSARYRRLLPGRSPSGTIVCRIPVYDSSPVYNFRIHSGRMCRRRVDRVILELGYFGDDLPTRLASRLAPVCLSPRLDLPLELLTGIADAVCIDQSWEGLDTEQAVHVAIDNLQVPCVAIVDDE